MSGSRHASPAARPAPPILPVRGAGSPGFAARVLAALRPVPRLASAGDIHDIVRQFAQVIGASRCVMAVVERGPQANSILWICGDVHEASEPLRPEYRRMLASAAGPGHGRAVCHALDDEQSLAMHDVLRGLDAYCVVMVVVETAEPSQVAGCMSLVFDREQGPLDACGRGQLTELSQHAAQLLLDSYLNLPAARPGRVRLSGREAECLQWAAAGKTSWETAHILGLSERTVNFHLGNAFAKLKVNNKQAAVAQAISQGLLRL